MNQPDNTNEVARLRAEVQRAIEDRNRIVIEVARLRGELQRLRVDFTNLRESYSRAMMKEVRDLQKLGKAEAEVARLREILEPFARFAELPGAMNLYGVNGALLRREDWENAIKALAPAPEEPAPDHLGDVNKMIPEWRELGEDEVIREGDEVKGVGGEWFKVEQSFPWAACIGAKAGECGSVIFHTRRPLPKQEDDFQACIDGAMEQAKLVHEGASSLAIACLIDAIRYLRDEIQKLKEAR